MRFSSRSRAFLAGAACCCIAAGALPAAPPARVVLIAGKPSHPPGAHEHNAGILLIEKFLRQNKGVETVVVRGGWPDDEAVFNGARAVVFFCDGGRSHPVLAGDRLDGVGRLVRKRVGLVMLHYAVDVPKDKAGEQFLDWLGGYYESGYSRNPITDAQLEQTTPRHPISRGWKSFDLRDEWYYHIRFRPGDRRVTPILTMLPPRVPERETVAWAIQREDGGRGFGFTGAHFHTNWGHPAFRRLVINAILWTAGLNVPKAGARCDLAPEELTRNLDDKPAPTKLPVKGAKQATPGRRAGQPSNRP